jgi:hypothetical protein
MFGHKLTTYGHSRSKRPEQDRTGQTVMIYAKHEFTTNLGAKMYTMHDTDHKRPNVAKEHEQHVGYVVIHIGGERKYLDTLADQVQSTVTISEWDEAVNVHENMTEADEQPCLCLICQGGEDCRYMD